MSRVYIFDTTLRDGEQSPGCSMTMPEKLRMAEALVDLGVDILEAAQAEMEEPPAVGLPNLGAEPAAAAEPARKKNRATH